MRGFLTELIDQLSNIIKAASPDTTKTIDGEKDAEKTTDGITTKETPDHESKIPAAPLDVKSKVETVKLAGTHLPLTLDGSLPTSILRKDFRILGQIGGPNQKDKLAWVSLQHQILEGKEAG